MKKFETRCHMCGDDKMCILVPATDHMLLLYACQDCINKAFEEVSSNDSEGGGG